MKQPAHFVWWLLLLAAGPAFPNADSDPLVASVTVAQGKVSVDRDSRAWAVSTGETIAVQKIITTGDDGYARFAVRGGASFDIYADSRVAFRKNAGSSGDLLDVLAGRVRIHLQPDPGERSQRVFCRSAIITAREGATVALAVDEDGNVRVDVVEGEVLVQHALLPRSAPTLVKAIDAIIVQPDEQITRRMERGTLYRYTLGPLRQLYEALTARGGPRVQEQPFASGT